MKRMLCLIPVLCLFLLAGSLNHARALPNAANPCGAVGQNSNAAKNAANKKAAKKKAANKNADDENDAREKRRPRP